MGAHQEPKPSSPEAYDKQSQRVADYITERTGVGGGDDPVGFLLASHDYAVRQGRDAKQLARFFASCLDTAGLLTPGYKAQLDEIDPTPSGAPSDPKDYIVVYRDVRWMHCARGPCNRHHGCAYPNACCVKK